MLMQTLKLGKYIYSFPLFQLIDLSGDGASLFITRNRNLFNEFLVYSQRSCTYEMIINNKKGLSQLLHLQIIKFYLFLRKAKIIH